MTPPAPWIAVLAAVCVAACSPALDWREFVPEGTDLHVGFPCRPDRHARQVTVADAPTRMEMLSCSAGDATFAVAFVDVADPARVGATLAALRATTIGNLQGAGTQPATPRLGTPPAAPQTVPLPLLSPQTAASPLAPPQSATSPLVPPQPATLQIPGMTPNPEAARLIVAGRLPDGAAVQAHAAFFTRGLRVYQATVIGAQPALPVVETFFAALKFAG